MTWSTWENHLDFITSFFSVQSALEKHRLPQKGNQKFSWNFNSFLLQLQRTRQGGFHIVWPVDLEDGGGITTANLRLLQLTTCTTRPTQTSDIVSSGVLTESSMYLCCCRWTAIRDPLAKHPFTSILRSQSFYHAWSMKHCLSFQAFVYLKHYSQYLAFFFSSKWFPLYVKWQSQTLFTKWLSNCMRYTQLSRQIENDFVK